METVDQRRRFHRRVRRTLLALAPVLFLYFAVISVAAGGPGGLFEYEHKKVSESMGVSDSVIDARHGIRGWNMLTGMRTSSLGMQHLTFYRLRIEKYVPLWLLGIDLATDPTEFDFRESREST